MLCGWQWMTPSHRLSTAHREVTLFELAPHPFFELRLGDVVFIPPYLVPERGIRVELGNHMSW